MRILSARGMVSERWRRGLLGLGLLLPVLSGCGEVPESTSTPTPEASPTSIPGASETPAEATPTATVSGSPTPSQPPGVTATPDPAQTPAQTPTQTPAQTPAPTEAPASPTPTAIPITPTPQVLLVPEGAELPQTLEPVLQVPSPGFVHAFPDFTLIYEQDGHLYQEADGSGLPADLGTALGTPHAAVWLEGVGPLVSGAKGLYVISGGSLVLSPLNAALASTTPVTLLTGAGPSGQDLWLVASTGLYLYRAGTLYRINLQSAFSPALSLAYGAPVGGVPSLWLSGSTGTWSLTEKSGKFSLRSEHPAALSSLAVDEAGSFFGLVDGLVLRRDASDVWRYLAAEGEVLSLQSASGGGLWLLTSEGVWWLQSQTGAEKLQKVAAASLSGLTQLSAPVDALWSVDPWGRLLLSTADAGGRVETGLPILLDGASAPLSYPSNARVYPSFAEAVTSVEVRCDGNLIALPERPWSLALDPLELGEGEHSLDVKVVYPGQTSSARYPISIQLPQPTWAVEITQIYEENCIFCHGPDGGAHPLYTSEQWEEEIDAIIGVTSSGYMPLGRAPLSAEQVYTLKVWQVLNFP